MNLGLKPKTQVAPYAFISPFYILFAAFMLVPVAGGVYLSLTDWSGLGTPQFIGLRNYQVLFADDSFYAALANTGIFVVISVGVVVPLSLMVALALNARGLKGRDFWRLAFFVPTIVSPIVIALIFGLLFNREYGLINIVLNAVLTIPPVNWTGDPTWAKITVSILIIWRWTGYLSIFFLAGLQAVPKELYESAALDGAGAVRRFWNVTLPMLSPVSAFVAVTVLVGSAQIFDEPFLLTAGGPGDATLSVVMYVYRAAFGRQQIGFSCAAAVVLFVIVFALGRLGTRATGVGSAR